MGKIGYEGLRKIDIEFGGEGVYLGLVALGHFVEGSVEKSQGLVGLRHAKVGFCEGLAVLLQQYILAGYDGSGEAYDVW